MHRVSLLPFPYPYRAMLAFSNDIDGTPWEGFRAIHKAFDDLGVPLADSVFAYQATGAAEYAFGLLDYPSLSPAKLLATLRELIRDGKVDTLHGLGNYSGVGGVKREETVRAAEALIREGIELPVWTNHGDRHNRQNIGIASGGDPESEAYVGDLLAPLGVRFVWASDLCPYVGQGRKLTIKETYRDRRLHPSALVRSLGLVRYLAKMIFTMSSPLDHASNDLIFPLTLADGRSVWAFRRFGRWERAWRIHLGEILSDENLKTLAAAGGYMVVYIHLGLPPAEPAALFGDGERAALRRLGEYRDRRRILVTTTARLLSYHRVRRHLRFGAQRAGGQTVISIDTVADPVCGDRVPAPADLCGISFRVPDVSRAVIEIAGRKADHHLLGHGRRSSGYIGFPWDVVPGRRKERHGR